jgi:ligand-binding sensor domain-containing protein
MYNQSHGLSSSEIWSLAEDRAGRIYAGTARGVDQLDPSTGRFVHWTEADGLAAGDIQSALGDRHGDLWFLSSRG